MKHVVLPPRWQRPGFVVKNEEGALSPSRRPSRALRRRPCLPACHVFMRCSHRQCTDNKQVNVSIQCRFLVLRFVDPAVALRDRDLSLDIVHS